MSARAPDPTGQVVPFEASANRRRGKSAAGRLGSSLMTIHAALQMAEMERVFGGAGNYDEQMEALATLRRWQVDPRLDSASRQRTSALVWRFQPNGWDEV